ncbi:C39 family peptidase [Clostridium sp. ZS2-4]|uniref:C39 family peptidase n=1 Tax=Clostridium sp. ZS2-4 TaxID=2987703 RepID=UPI00227C4B80|nr:C39 family peptidase [Clostridium sp. ZS2-4]MCY6354886.1 C39 family peptidase [Clostridium sp. ZS2-4]
MNYICTIQDKKNKAKKIILAGTITLSLTIISYVSPINFNAFRYNITHNMVQNSKASIIQKLEDNSTNSPKIKEILSNIELYPKELLELASKKYETIDFVYNYPTNKNTFTNKKFSVESDYTPGKFPLFMQWDERWGYDKYGNNFIAINGCGPTSLAMVIVGLTGNTDINPKVVADFSQKNGYYINNVGSKWSLMTEGAKQFGLKSLELPLNESVILSTLKNEEPIVAIMGPGNFTTSGHFIVLTGITEDGKIIVNDCDSKINSKKTWDIDIFMHETKKLWKFSI